MFRLVSAVEHTWQSPRFCGPPRVMAIQCVRPVRLWVGPVLMFGVACAGGEPHPLDFVTDTCTLEGVEEELTCGVLSVFENRDARMGRRIGIHVIVAPATGSEVAPDPLFLFAGGPGLAPSTSVRMALGRWASVRTKRDLVLVDLRGTGKSHPLGCPLPGRLDDADTYLRSVFEIDAVRACRDSLAQSADLTMYATSVAVEDVDDIRRALGYELINFYGVSYGSLVGQEYLRRHGDHVRSAILHGPVPPTDERLLTVPQLLDSLIVRTVADCLARPACSQAHPDVKRHLDRLLTRLAPDTVTASVPQGTSRPREIRLPFRHVAELLETMLYSAEDAADLPALLGLMAGERYGPLVPVILRVRRGLHSGRLAWGLYLSVSCSELLPARRAEAIARARRTITGAGELRELYEACALWPRSRVPPDFHRPVESSVPTVVVSGELDPVTPPVLGDLIVGHLSRGRHLVLRNTAHEPNQDVWDRCLEPILRAFLADPDPDGLDVTCAERLSRPGYTARE